MSNMQLPPFSPVAAIYFRPDLIIIAPLWRDVYGRLPPGDTMLQIPYDASEVELGTAVLAMLHKSKAGVGPEQFDRLSNKFLSALGAPEGDLEQRWSRVERNWNLITSSMDQDRAIAILQKMKRHGKGGYVNDGEPYEAELTADRIGHQLREYITSRSNRLR